VLLCIYGNAQIIVNMAFYLRKAFKTGPVRFNLSKGGIGISVGVTGARIGLNRRGAYVHGGRHGVYYRKHLKVQRTRDGGASGDIADSRVGLGAIGDGGLDGFIGERTDSVSRGSAARQLTVTEGAWGPGVYDVRERGAQVDVFVDTGVTYPPVMDGLRERAMPKPPPKGSTGSTVLHVFLGLIAVNGAMLLHPLFLLMGVVPLGLMVRARLQHQRYMDKAAAFLDVLRTWMAPVAVAGASTGAVDEGDESGVEADGPGAVAGDVRVASARGRLL
jgi:hypothetical protein